MHRVATSALCNALPHHNTLIIRLVPSVSDAATRIVAHTGAKAGTPVHTMQVSSSGSRVATTNTCRVRFRIHEHNASESTKHVMRHNTSAGCCFCRTCGLACALRYANCNAGQVSRWKGSNRFTLRPTLDALSSCGVRCRLTRTRIRY